jgi:hypothetical protein
VLLKAWRFVTLLSTALALTMTSAHVLELAPKMAYSPSLYAAVNGSLYRWFAIVGGTYQVLSTLAAVALVFLVRHRRPSLYWTAAGASLLVLSLVSWVAIVEPVNLQVADAFARAQPVAPLWLELRPRWEYGHLVGFVLELAGLCALLVSVLVDTPARLQQPARGAA